MKRLILFSTLVIVAFLLSFTNRITYAEESNAWELGVKKTSIGYQADVISAFIENGIPFYVDSEGILKYPGKYEDKAMVLLDKLNKRPEVQFNDYKYASLFIILLKKNNIDFVIRDGANKMDIHIVYEDKDKKTVDEIVYPEFVRLVEKGSKTGVYGSQGYPPSTK